MKILSLVRSVSALIVCTGLVAGCSYFSGHKTAKAEAATADAAPAIDPAAGAAIAAAKTSVDAAKANNWIWRDTEDELKQAQDAAAAGDSKKAIELANTAKNEADLAVEQYKLETTKFR